MDALPEHLRRWLDNADNWKGERIDEIDLPDGRYVIKRREAYALGRLALWAKQVRAWLVARVCGWLFGVRPAPAALLHNDIQAEGQRLQYLFAHGQRVPEVLLSTPDILVMRNVGEVLTDVLRDADSQARLHLLDRAVQDTARFHREGFWHGGAQLRNLTLEQDGRLWRIDFEESAGDVLPLAVIQAYDFFQMLQSVMMSPYYAKDDKLHLGRHVLYTYLQAHPEPDVRASLVRIGRMFRRISWLLRLLARIPGRDVQAFVRTGAVMQLLLNDGTDDSQPRPPA
ncbi:MAG: hypothetical protein ABN482_12055 [Corticimicrobacter sp.]|uniref:hypothetical protein n=1 Tax=Corticimicrobacter sp. TaxID=2678536 RepID=UPI0032DBAD16